MKLLNENIDSEIINVKICLTKMESCRNKNVKESIINNRVEMVIKSPHQSKAQDQKNHY